jgi:SAM-dependent methyltransferase
MNTNNTFSGWENIGNFSLDIVADYILTGRKAYQFYPDIFSYTHLMPSRILDFGCGIGRNTFGISIYDPTFSVVGYDNQAMLSHVDEYKNIKYSEREFPNVEFSSDWDYVQTQKFDTIFCAIVLQHIMENDLKAYIEQFKIMTSKLVVSGRRFNDDKEHRSTWRIIEECGLIPVEFYSGGGQQIDYVPDGDQHDHNLAVYEW